MKNKILVILSFLAVFGAAGNVFAGRTLPETNYPYSGAGRTHTNVVPVGMTSYSKEGGVQIRTIMGEVRSINTEKGLFIVDDKHDGVTATVLTDANTIASLHPGDVVTVKLRSGSPMAHSVITASQARTNNAAPVGKISYTKGNKTITGEVVSVNANKDVFVVEDKRDRITETVSTDAQTIASLRPGQVVTVRLHSGSPIADSVEIGNY